MISEDILKHGRKLQEIGISWVATEVFFTMKKKDDSYRMIVNLNKFSKILLVLYCNLESIQDDLNLITEGCYFALLHLEDAYYSKIFIVSILYCLIA